MIVCSSNHNTLSATLICSSSSLITTIKPSATLHTATSGAHGASSDSLWVNSSEVLIPTSALFNSVAMIKETINTNKLMSTVMLHTGLMRTEEKPHTNSILGGVIGGGIILTLLMAGIIMLHFLFALFLCLKKAHKNIEDKALSKGNSSRNLIPFTKSSLNEIVGKMLFYSSII